MKEYKPYLLDVLDCIAKIKRYIHDHDFETFCSDDRTADAVIRNVEVIGEAIKQVPEIVRKKYPDIPWRQIAGMRDKLIHDYLGVDLEYVWNVADKRIDGLAKEIKAIIDREKE